MNKFKIAILSATAAAFLAPAFASAEGMYVSIGGGYDVVGKKKFELEGDEIKRKNGTSLNLELGTSLGDFRIGGEFSHMFKEEYTFQDDKLKLKNTSVFLNGYYDINGLSDMFVPYVTAGFGPSHAWFEVEDEDGKKKKYHGVTFAYKVGLGSRVNVSESVTLDLSYRYAELGKFNKADVVKKRNFHTFNGGVVFKF
jgi:opacity protein-like surface antigen